MNYSDRQELTEDAPLTQGRIKGLKLICSEDGGLKLTVISFTVLSIAVTVALGLQLIYNDNVSQGRTHGAVATDCKECSEIGTGVLRKGGNAVDAAIAATICMAVVRPHKTGLGGGGYAMIYSHEDRGKPVIIDFAKNTVQGAFGNGNVRIPAVLKGLATAHSLNGKLPWEELVSPSAKLSREGFIVTKEFAQEVEKDSAFIKLYGQLEPGQNLTLPKLSETLDVVAKHGADELYNGSLSQNIFAKPAAIEILKQLENYKAEIKRANVTNFYDHLVYYPPDAIAIKHSLEIINALKISYQNASSLESQASIAAVLIDNIMDLKVTDAEERFSSVVVMDGMDSYVVIITGLSAAFGSGRITDAGFLIDSAASNLERLTPLLFCDAVSVCGLRGIIGLDDATLTVELFYNLMVRKLSVSEAVENARYYLMADGIAIEHGMDPMLRAQLDAKIAPSKQNADQLLKSCNAIVKIKDTMNSHSDSRGDGLASRFR